MSSILGTGLNGLVGSHVVDLLSPKYSFTGVSRATGVDITNYDSVMKVVSESTAEIVLHMAAYTDVKKAEQERDLGKESEAYRINVIGTQNIVKACSQNNKKLIYITTDLVLGGDDMPQGGYREDAVANPLSWYAVTKYEGENAIRETLQDAIIARIAYPYRASFEKPDFVRFFRKLLSEGKSLDVLSDRFVTPTFIDDIALAIEALIENKASGTYHVVGSQILSMHDAVILIAEKFGLDKSLVGTTTREEFLINRPPEPFSSALNNDKITELGVKMSSFSEGLDKMIEQGIN